MSTVPTTFNPSDYEFLLKSVTEGNLVSKAESLKRLNTLVVTDKKQFSIYAKRVVISIQDLLMEPKQDVNLLAGTLVLQIINLNPRQIQYYIRTKLLKSMVRNLGDPKPQIRKTSHYCLLAYVKTYKTFDELIQIYLHFGFQSESWQLRQKAINSFQSILIMEMKYLNWSSSQFKRIVEQLLNRTKDQSQYVQKAAEQCLISICKNQQVRNFSKKLPPSTFNVLKDFCQAMFDQGMLQEIKIYVPQLPSTMIKNFSSVTVRNQQPAKSVEKPITFQKIKMQIPNGQTTPHSLNTKQAIISKIQQMRKKTHSPLMDKQFIQEKQRLEQRALKKVESVSIVPRNNVQKQKQIALPSLRKSIQIQDRIQLDSQMRANLKSEKTDAAIGRKLIDDLKNQKDWKIRLEAIQELNTKFNASKGTPQAQNIAKNFLPILVKLLGDPNFKVALISLKIIQQILQFESSNISLIIPQLVEKISDGKIALRQNISRLIRLQFNRTGNKLWLTQLLGQLKKSPPPNSNIKQQILNLLSKITIEAQQNEKNSRMQLICLNLQQIVEAVCPLMDDLKTKIKIRTLDLLILLSVRTNQIEFIKSMLASKLNQVYFQMYLQKVAKQTKNFNIIMNEAERGTTPGDRRSRNQRMNLVNRRYKATGNTTSSTIRKHSSMEMIDENNTTVKTAIFVNKNNIDENEQQQEDAVSQRQNHKEPGNQNSSDKKTIIKSYRRKNFDYKSTQYSAFSVNNVGQLPPFHDPEKQLKNIINEIKSEEWQTCSEALTKLRRIIENHSELLNHALIRLLVPQIMRLVESLRSNLSKTAVMTLNDLSNKMKKMLDSELDSMFSKLIKKTLDANSFISEQVRRALISICSNCNQNRVVSLLMNSHSSRAIPIKISIANVLQSIAFLPKFYDKQLERIVTMLVNFLSEGSLQIRDKSKSILSAILSSQKGQQMMKLVPGEHLHKLTFKAFKSLQKSEIRNNQVQNPERREDMSQSRLIKKRKQKIVVFPQQFQKLQNLLQQCESSDWKNRQKNMSLINQIVIIPYPRQFIQHRLSGKVMDVLSKQIGDPNVKVASNALKILKQIPKTMPQIIEHNLSVLANQVFNCFGSHKPEIKQLAEQLFDQISQNIQKWMLVQHMCNGALYGLQKSRPQIIMRLAQLLPSIYAKGKKKTLLSKNLYPLINKLVEQNKPQNYEGLVALMQTCDVETQGEFLSGLKPKSIQFYSSIKNNG